MEQNILSRLQTGNIFYLLETQMFLVCQQVSETFDYIFNPYIFIICLSIKFHFLFLVQQVLIMYLFLLSCTQSCLTHCSPMDCSLPGFSVHRISRQEYWSGLPFLLQGIFPTQGSNLCLLGLPALAGIFFTTALPGKSIYIIKLT